MFKNIVYSLITKGSVGLINFLILIISSRYLGVSSRGEISIFILNISIIQIINEVYTGYNLVHFIPKFNLKKIVVHGLFYTFIFCSLSNLMIVFLNKQVLGYEWLAYLVSLLVLINTFNCVLILGKEKIRVFNWMNFIQPFLLLLGLTIGIFIFKSFTFAAYIYPLFISFSLATIMSAIQVFKFFVQKDINSTYYLKPILINGMIFQSSTLLYIFCNRYSYYLLANSASVGLYASASSLTEAVLIISNAISPLLLARVANSGNTKTSIQLTLSLAKFATILSGLLILTIALIPVSFFVFVLGEGFIGIKHLMMLYSPAILMISFFLIMSNYFIAIGKQKIVLVSYGFGFIASLILAPLLISRYGTNGAAYSALISYSIITLSLSLAFLINTKTSVFRFFSLKSDCHLLREIVLK